ncbi:MAG: hypothetical protein IPN79_03825 [Saprospiraceae bacterium]|nr:hypothetical protein [Saprospiraceae bacterium]
MIFFITVFPWLYWIFISFPNETRLIFEGVLFPISNVVQGHSGMWYYYLNSIRININELVYIPLLFFIYHTLKKPSYQNILIFLWIIIPLLLLSVSTTKREVYILISATPLFIIISLFINFIEKFKFKYEKSVYFIQMLFFIVAIRYCVERLKPWEPRLEKPEYRYEMEALINRTSVSSDSLVLINDPNFIKGRFYYGVLGYRYLNDSTINNIRSKGYKVFNNVNGKYIPIE